MADIKESPGRTHWTECAGITTSTISAALRMLSFWGDIDDFSSVYYNSFCLA
jgi:hypothetical protein